MSGLAHPAPLKYVKTNNPPPEGAVKVAVPSGAPLVTKLCTGDEHADAPLGNMPIQSDNVAPALTFHLCNGISKGFQKKERKCHLALNETLT